MTLVNVFGTRNKESGNDTIDSYWYNARYFILIKNANAEALSCRYISLSFENAFHRGQISRETLLPLVRKHVLLVC